MPSPRPFSVLALLTLLTAPAVSGWAGPGRRETRPDAPPRRGSRVEIVSPDRAETWVNGHTIRHVLLWDRRREALLAQITFDNFHEVDWEHPRREETFSFYLPGVVRDAGTGVFTTASGVPVAMTQRAGLGAGSIQPTSGTTLFVTKPNGQVHVVLTATPGSPVTVEAAGGGRWRIEGVDGVL